MYPRAALVCLILASCAPGASDDAAGARGDASTLEGAAAESSSGGSSSSAGADAREAQGGSLTAGSSSGGSAGNAGGGAAGASGGAPQGGSGGGAGGAQGGSSSGGADAGADAAPNDAAAPTNLLNGEPCSDDSECFSDRCDSTYEADGGAFIQNVCGCQRIEGEFTDEGFTQDCIDECASETFWNGPCCGRDPAFTGSFACGCREIVTSICYAVSL